MPIDWSADKATKTVCIRLCGALSEPDCLALARGVAMVTDTYEDFAVRVDCVALGSLPGYAALVRIAHEIERLCTPPHSPLAFISPTEDAPRGQCRQLVTLLGELALPARLFPGEAEADAWLESCRSVC